MSAKYHTNDDGVTNKCDATVRECPVGGEHYPSAEEAREAYEKKQNQHLDDVYEGLKKKKKASVLGNLGKMILGLEDMSPETYNSITRLENFFSRRKKAIISGAVGAALLSGLVAGGAAYANSHYSSEYVGTATSNSQKFQETYRCGSTKVGNSSVPIHCNRTRYKAEVEWNGQQETFKFTAPVKIQSGKGAPD